MTALANGNPPTPSSGERDAATQQLLRAAVLHARIVHGIALPRHHAEHDRLKRKLAKRFLPTIDALITAGVISIEVDLSSQEIPDLNQHESVVAEAETASRNDGGIWITGRYDGGSIRT
jgi:hypothetical protein